jgi:hypothetical protein
LLTAIGTASDITLGTGAWVGYGAGSIAAVKEAVAPRFRLGAGSKTAWVASLNYIDKLQSVPSFSGSLMPLVDQSGPLPRLLGSSVYESSSMTTATGAGSRVLIYGDFSQSYIVDRWPSHVLFEPLIVGTGANAQLPTGQSGWFFSPGPGWGRRRPVRGGSARTELGRQTGASGQPATRLRAPSRRRLLRPTKQPHPVGWLGQGGAVRCPAGCQSRVWPARPARPRRRRTRRRRTPPTRSLA